MRTSQLMSFYNGFKRALKYSYPPYLGVFYNLIVVLLFIRFSVSFYILRPRI